MQNQASMISSSLSALESLTPDGVGQVMRLLDYRELSRVMVTDADGQILYDTTETGGTVGRYALFSEVSLAMSGYDVFYSNFTNGAFRSTAASPIMYRGAVIGAIYICEYDSEQGELLLGIKNNLKNISILVVLVAILLGFVFATTLTRRLKKILDAIDVVRDGEYSYRLEIKGKDEISQIADEFNSLTDRLQKTDEVRRRFVSDASHELKTPLASIRLLSDSILQTDNMDGDTVKEFVNDIGNEADRLTRTTEKLLRLTRLDSEIKTAPSRVDMGGVVRATVRSLMPLANKSGVSLTYRLNPDCFILASGDDMHQVVFNLAENGIKYNMPGGEVQILLFRSENNVLLIVNDTGIGIPEEDMQHIFDRFYRVDKARSREAGGSGLGLSIVHDTVLEHGGTIKVERRMPRGTSFIVSFPYCAAEDGGGEK